MQNSLYEEVIIAGFGGQGIILISKLLAQAAMRTGKEVTYMPSYGAEVRGGTANCMVVIANSPIASPVFSRCDSLIAMNKASFNKFAPQVKKGGLLIVNTSLIEPEMVKSLSGNAELSLLPADDLAIELGSPKSANMVALGAYLQKRGFLTPDEVAECLPDVLAKRLHNTLAINAKALHCGAEFVRTHNS